jgi:hypothetical protein
MTLKWHYISMFENFDNFLVVWHGCWFDWLWSRPYGKFIDRYILYIKVIVSVYLSVCVGSAWKILLVTARSPEITHLNTLNRAFLTVSIFGHLEFACTRGVHQNLDMEFLRTWFSGREISVLGRTRCGFPRPKPRNFLDMIFTTWDPQFLETWSLHSGFPRPKKT